MIKWDYIEDKLMSQHHMNLMESKNQKVKGATDDIKQKFVRQIQSEI